MCVLFARFVLATAIGAIAAPAFAADLSGGIAPPIGDPVYSPARVVTGHLNMGLGFFNFDTLPGFSDETVGMFAAAGRANFVLSDTWNAQVEAGGFTLFRDGDSASAIGAVGHLWTKLDNAAVGVYGGVNDTVFGATVGMLGVEGEMYLGDVTLGADANYNWSSGTDFWRAAGWADLYLNPNFRVGAELSYAAGDIPTTWGAQLDSEYRFQDKPYSGWGEVGFASVDGASDIWTGLVGVRFFMDDPGATLIEHDRDVPWDAFRGILAID